MFSYEVIQSLNNLELSLYEYIMKNKKKVIYMRIRELADEAHVSTTTILRFCKKLNCEGFSEFKVKFKMYIERKAGALFSKMHIWLNEPLDEVSCLILNVVADII